MILTKFMKGNYAHGFSVVEVLLAVSIFALIVTALFGAYFYGQEASVLAGNRTRAAIFAEEGLEATRNIRDAGFVNLTDGTHGLSIAGNQWTFSGSSDTSGIFTRSIAVSSLDSHRKQVASTVTWQQNPQRIGTISLVAELTEWLRSVSGKWASVSEKGNANLSNAIAGIKIAVSGSYAYVIRNEGSADNFLVIDVSNISSPSVTATIDLSGTPSNIAVSGNYAYVSSSDNSEELQVVNISNPTSPSLVGLFNAVGNADGEGIAIVGAYAYLVRASSPNEEFVIVNISNPVAPSLVGSLDLGAAGNEVAILGSTAFIASSDNSRELIAVNIATPSLPLIIGSLDISGNANANTIVAFGSTALLGVGSMVYSVNVSVPSIPLMLGFYDTGGVVNDIALDSGGSVVFVADSNNAAEFQVIDFSSLASPALLGLVDVSGNIDLLGVVYDVNQDAAYAVGDDSSKEFLVFAP